MATRTKIFIALVALAVLVGGGWLFYTGRSEATFARPTPAQISKAAEVLARDRDNDGLKDWEEELWKTDILNPDSDGDGTPDGEEIQKGRDPLKAGPEDALEREVLEAKTVPGGGDWSETDRVSRELFARYLSIKQSGQPFTAEDEEALLADFISRYPERRTVKVYTVRDLASAKADDEAAWRAYGNAVGEAIRAHTEKQKGEESELVIFERALANEDEIDLANLKNRVERYQALVDGFAAVPVPKSVGNTALNLINAVAALKESVSGMALAFTDPVRALSAATGYPTAVNRLTDALTGLAEFFKQNEVVFGEEEAGTLLTK